MCRFTSHGPGERRLVCLFSGGVLIKLLPLTHSGFAKYGRVIDSAGGGSFPTNRGEATRIHALSDIDCSAEDGRAIISIFQVHQPTAATRLRLMERHPISSQAFVPLDLVPTIVVVAPADETPSHENIQAFLTDGRQGFSYLRGTWHHPLITLSAVDSLLSIGWVLTTSKITRRSVLKAWISGSIPT